MPLEESLELNAEEIPAQEDKAMRIVILTYESLYANIITERLLQKFPGEIAGVVHSTCIIYRKSLLQSAWFLLTRSGLPFVLRKAIEIFQSKIAMVVFRLMGKKRQVHSLGEMSALYHVPLLGSADVNRADTMERLAGWQPNLVISVYLNQLIKSPLIKLGEKGCLNIHPALLPRHRGLFPYFWVLTNNETETGVTVHWVEEKFDTGDILLQKHIEVSPDDTIQSLSYKCAQAGADALEEAVRLVAAGQAPHIPQNMAEASYHSWPRPDDYRNFHKNGGQYGGLHELFRYM